MVARAGRLGHGRSVVHDRHVAAGAHFNASFGWEFPEWFAVDEQPAPVIPGFHRQPSHALERLQAPEVMYAP